jgi:phosphoglycerate dehydrogenase-like enzyme
MTILFYTHLAHDFPEYLDQLRSEFPEHRFEVAGSREEFITLLPRAEVAVWGHPEEELLEKAPKLRTIFVPFTGINRVPAAYLRRRGITVSNNHGNAVIAAERAVALSLALLGRVVEFHNGLTRGFWHRRDDPNHPFEYWNSLAGKAVTVLGTGAIGSHVAGMLRGFQCRITGFRRRAGSETPPGFDRVTNDLAEACAASRLIIIALPLTSATAGLFNSETIGLLHGKWVANVARGEIIGEEPLYNGLAAGEIAGAALDVWYRYPEPFNRPTLPARYPFHSLPNVVMSPHAASHSVEGKRFQMEGTVKNIRALLRTGRPEDVADLEAGY